MTDNVIYFPNIRVPNSAWFTRVLLYWDQVGSIVPTEYIDTPEELGPYMQSLVQEELVRQVFPSDQRRTFRNSFADEFLEMLKRNETIKERIGGPLDDSSALAIHGDKLGFNFRLAGELCALGLARKDDPWYHVEPTTAHLYMAYLATVMGRSEDLLMQPITDTAESLAVFGQMPAEASSLEAHAESRMMVLEGLLPAPSQEISAAELARFKEANWPELRRFRREVDEELSLIARQPDDDYRSEMLRYTQGRWSREVEHLTWEMKSRGWLHITSGTLCVMAGGAMSGAASAGLLGELGSAAGLFGAVLSAVAGRRIFESGLMPEPMAYAALAKARLA